MQVYDSPEDDLKLNDVFEFFGVLTFDAEISDDKDDSDEFTSCEDELAHLPPRKVLTSSFCCRWQMLCFFWSLSLSRSHLTNHV